jgi:GNAT superfamily N-acetyltransferase
MEIAPAKLTDREDVLALLRAQMAEHAIDLPTADLAAAIDGVLAEAARGVLFLARAEGAAVGVAYLSFTWAIEHGGRVGWLEELYVVPAERGHGIGTALLGAVSARARAAGCRALDLEVDAGHARAAVLYTRHGFRGLPRARFTLRLGEP